MLENGDSQKARFHFPAFRFIEQQNETLSTYYLHCITRLCERSTCSTFKVGRPHMHVKQKSPVNPDRMINSGVSLVWFDPQQCNNRRRRRRGVESTVIQESITEPSVLTVAIRTKTETCMSPFLCKISS